MDDTWHVAHPMRVNRSWPWCAAAVAAKTSSRGGTMVPRMNWRNGQCPLARDRQADLQDLLWPCRLWLCLWAAGGSSHPSRLHKHRQ